jgi:hypothetical protein
MRGPLLALLLLLPSLAAAAPAADTWMSVLLGGRKIGHMHTSREIRDGSVITSQKMNIELSRAGITVALATSEVDAETPEGEPVAFVSITSISGIANTVTGTRRGDGKFTVVSEIGGAKSTRIIDWPKGALLNEGLRLAELDHGLAPGTRFSELAFQAENQTAVQVESTIAAREHVELPEGTQPLMRVEQLVRLPGAATQTRSWIDADGNVRKTVLPVMGMDLTLIACARACALAPNQGADILDHAMAQAPAALSPAWLRDGIIIDIRARSGAAPLRFAQTAEQRVSTTADGIELRIAPLGATAAIGSEAAPTLADTQANDWLQSDSAQIRALAQQGVDSARTPQEKMHNLQEFVRRFIRTKDLSVGYASALEVAKNPEGDCTEHAVLLAALARAQGIPARVVDGLAYADRYAGMDHVFVPHAWVQAYVDGHWQSFDAALNGFDSGHIALAVGDGDPWRFFAGFDTLGRMRIERVSALTAARH